MKRIFIVGSILLFLFIPNAFAHPGRTDSSGCHTCRTNCSSWGLSSGEYHCHQAKTTTPQPLEPVTSHKSDAGVGYTEPAPEYKIPLMKEKVKSSSFEGLLTGDKKEVEVETTASVEEEIKNIEVDFKDEIEVIEERSVKTKEVKGIIVEGSNNSSNESFYVWFWMVLAGGVGYYYIKKK